MTPSSSRKQLPPGEMTLRRASLNTTQDEKRTYLPTAPHGSCSCAHTLHRKPHVQMYFSYVCRYTRLGVWFVSRQQRSNQQSVGQIITRCYDIEQGSGLGRLPEPPEDWWLQQGCSSAKSPTASASHACGINGKLAAERLSPITHQVPFRACGLSVAFTTACAIHS